MASAAVSPVPGTGGTPFAAAAAARAYAYASRVPFDTPRRHEDGGLRLTIDETRPLRVVSPTMGGKAD